MSNHDEGSKPMTSTEMIAWLDSLSPEDWKRELAAARKRLEVRREARSERARRAAQRLRETSDTPIKGAGERLRERPGGSDGT